MSVTAVVWWSVVDPRTFGRSVPNLLAARRRWARMPAAERERRLAHISGLAASMSPAQRSRRASRAGRTKWANWSPDRRRAFVQAGIAAARLVDPAIRQAAARKAALVRWGLA